MIQSYVKKIPMQTRSTLELEHHLGGATVTIQGYGSMTMVFEPTPNPPLLAIRLLEVDLAWEPFELPLPGKQHMHVEQLRVRTEDFDLAASGGELNPETGELALKFVITLSPIKIPHMAHLGIAEPVTVVAIEKGRMNFATGHLIETHAEPFVLPFATVYAGQYDWTEVPGNGITNGSLSAIFNGTNLYLFMKGIDQKIYVNSTSDGTIWSNWSEVPGGQTTDVAPAAVRTAGINPIPPGPDLDLFVKGVDQKIYVNHFNGTTWGGWNEVHGGGTTTASLTGAIYGGPEFVFMKGIDQKIYVNGGLAGFGGWSEVPGHGATTAGLSVVYAGPSLYLFMKGLDQKIYMNVKPTGEDNWGGWSEVPGNGQTDAAPAVVAVPDGGPGMNLFAKGIQDQAVHINSTKDGFTWSGWSVDPGGGITDAALTGAYFSGHVYLFRKGIDQKVYFEFLL